MLAVFIRHATRDSHGLGDSSLNLTGRAQAEDLSEAIKTKRILPSPVGLYVSPKKRAQETLTPVSEHLGLKLNIDIRLDERKNSESPFDFEQRIFDFIVEVTKTPHSVVWICSHLDWLEAAMLLLPSDLSDLEQSAPWQTASYRVFSIEDGLWKFKGGGAIETRALIKGP